MLKRLICVKITEPRLKFMAKKTEKKYLKKFKKEAAKEIGDQEGEEKKPYLKSETKNGISIVFLIAVAILSILSFSNSAGDFGREVNKILQYLFGWGKFVFPAVLLVVVYFLFKPKTYILRLTNYIGLFLFVLAYSGILHLFVKLDQATKAITEGRGGGYFGLALSYPLQKIMGQWATAIILVALFLIGLLILFDTSLKRLYESGNIFKRVAERFREFFYKIKVNMEATKESVPPSEEAGADFAVKKLKETTRESPPAEEEVEKYKEKEQMAIFPKPKFIPRKIDIPMDLLEANHTKPTSGDIERNKTVIQKTLMNFGIEVEMGAIKVGPTVTQYTLKPKEGIKLAQITTLHNDLALALAAHPIRIEAPIPGQSLVGIEVPNQAVAVVKLKEILASDEFKKRSTNLTIALGKDVAGHPWTANLDKMPHLLIAGATGSGKTVCLNSIIVSLLYQNSPDNLKFILIDPKRVELPVYNGMPYLLTPVVTEIAQTISALRWTVGEMDRRFNILSKAGKRNIQVYNENTPEEPLPYIVVIIDELADLMATAASEVEGAIIRLAQMARAVGIHLIVATQRPSVDVITGLIKANITARIAFSVASLVDSRTILDTSGAEKLLGRGDMLYISAELSKPKRLQGAYVADQEIERVVNFVKSKAKPEYQKEILEKKFEPSISSSYEEVSDDELLPEARQLVTQTGKASASFLQRRLRVGYARAARLLDLMEEEGLIGPVDGAKPRDVYGAQKDHFASEETSEAEAEKVDSSAEEEQVDDGEQTPDNQSIDQ